MNTTSNPENTALAIRCMNCSTTLDWKFDKVFAPIQIAVQEYSTSRDHLSDQELSATIKGMLIVYWFSVWENYFTREDEEQYLNESHLERLKAFRHIRHTSAHGMDFTRARQCREEFENVMTSKFHINSVTYNADHMNISASEAAADCRDHLKKCVGFILNSMNNQA